MRGRPRSRSRSGDASAECSAASGVNSRLARSGRVVFTIRITVEGEEAGRLRLGESLRVKLQNRFAHTAAPSIGVLLSGFSVPDFEFVVKAIFPANAKFQF